VTALQRVHVLVGLIRDERGRWLVNQRRAGTHMAGWWEFPGGKSRPDEAPFTALHRELDEELGIDVRDAEAWFELAHDYPDKHVRLDIWRVKSFAGEITAREGQALRWVAADEFAGLQLLPADWPIVERLQQIAS
jgi:8-oxo-dGTP diphosphatase